MYLSVAIISPAHATMIKRSTSHHDLSEAPEADKGADSFVDAVDRAFKNTDRLQQVVDGLESHLVKVQFRNGCPHATRPAAEAHSCLLRGLIAAGALRTKALTDIKAGFIALDKHHNASLSKATSYRGQERWANHEAECTRKLLTYVKRSHARAGHPSSKI